MITQKTQKIGTRPAQRPVSKTDTLHDAWVVVKPFAKFSVKALQVLAHALIFIVKNIPKPHNSEDQAKKGKVIKI